MTPTLTLIDLKPRGSRSVAGWWMPTQLGHSRVQRIRDVGPHALVTLGHAGGMPPTTFAADWSARVYRDERRARDLAYACGWSGEWCCIVGQSVPRTTPAQGGLFGAEGL